MGDARLPRIEDRLPALATRPETAPAGLAAPEGFRWLQALYTEAAELPDGDEGVVDEGVVDEGVVDEVGVESQALLRGEDHRGSLQVR